MYSLCQATPFQVGLTKQLNPESGRLTLVEESIRTRRFWLYSHPKVSWTQTRASEPYESNDQLDVHSYQMLEEIMEKHSPE